MYLCNFRDCHYPSPVLPAFKSFGMSIMSAEAYVSRAATVFNELKKPYARNPRLCGRSGGRVAPVFGPSSSMAQTHASMSKQLKARDVETGVVSGLEKMDIAGSKYHENS